MSQYESSTATLKAILSHPLLQRDAVDTTLDAMADANAEARAVDDAIRGGLEAAQADGVAEIDEDEIQKELEELIQVSQREKGASDQAQKSPLSQQRTRAEDTKWVHVDSEKEEGELRALEESGVDAGSDGSVRRDAIGHPAVLASQMPETPIAPIGTREESSDAGRLSAVALPEA